MQETGYSHAIAGSNMSFVYVRLPTKDCFTISCTLQHSTRTISCTRTSRLGAHSSEFSSIISLYPVLLKTKTGTCSRTHVASQTDGNITLVKLLNVHVADQLRDPEVRTAETFIPEPSLNDS